ncbi:MAG: ABC transporter permease [Acetivibrionales bacterium]|jgi:ABC-type uncharacterized transport system permease subunit
MDNILDIITLIITTAIRMSIPVVLASVGSSFSFRGGVISFGCEGMMIVGSLTGVMGTLLTGNKWMGILFAVIGGGIISLLHAYLHVTHKVNATLSGMCVNLLGLGVTELLVQVIWNSKNYSPQIESFNTVSPDWLKNIPILGPILSQQYIFFYITFVIIVISWIFMNKTPYGLRLRMVGENPVAANTVGINTIRYKYFGVFVCGLLSGLGGAYLSMATLSRFQNGMTAGRGYIAMVTCALGNCNPLGSALGGLFFGFFDSFQLVFQGMKFPSQILMTMPYVFTLFASIIKLGSGSNAPAGIGKFADE